MSDSLENMRSHEPTKVVLLAIPVSVYDYLDKLAEHEGGWSAETHISYLVDRTIEADLNDLGLGWSGWPRLANEAPVLFEETVDARALRETELDEGGECV